MRERLRIYFDEQKAYAGLGKQSVRSGALFVAARGLNAVIQIGSTLCLARLLSPHDYGLVAMVSAAVGFAPMLIDLGTADAAVQKSKITREEVSSLFWLNMIIGGGLAAALACCSPLISWFYREPEVKNIALVSSLTFLFTALSIQHYSLLRRAMRFQTIAVIDTAANLLSTLAAIGMAFSGCGYWALAAKPILQAFLGASGVWWSCGWLPGKPTINQGVKELVRFGMHVTGFTMTDYAGRSADRIALGYVYGASSLGFFQNAFLLYDNLLSVLVSPLHSVAVASLSKLRENLEELRRSWAAALSAVAFFAMPMFGVLAVTGQDVVVLLLGQKWNPAGPLLCIFALRGIAHVAERTLGWLHVAAGRSDRWMRWGIISTVIQLAALFCALPFGLVGVACAYALTTHCLFLPALVYAGRPLGIRAIDVVKAVGPQLVSALVSAGIGFCIRDVLLAESSRVLRVSVLIVFCLLAYSFLSIGIFRVEKPLLVAKSLLRGSVASPLARMGQWLLRAGASKE